MNVSALNLEKSAREVQGISIRSFLTLLMQTSGPDHEVIKHRSKWSCTFRYTDKQWCHTHA